LANPTESELAPPVSPELRRVWVQQELRARQPRVSPEWQERRACQGQVSFLIEPIRKQWLALRLESRDGPPSALVPLPAAVTRGI